jgi:diguanylate cyclase (GGDEF)-like protein/PAS domain S-box-containing protein
LPAFGLLLIAGVWAATWLYLQATERALINAASHTTESLALEFEQYTRRAIQDVDRMTRLVKYEFEQHNSSDLSILGRDGLLVEGAVLSIADADGNIIARNQPYKPFSIGDREYFRLHAQRDTGLLDISKPVIGRVLGVATVLLSRRLNRDGAFAGLVLVSVTPEYFMDFYQESEIGKRGSLGLHGLDGTLRARRVGETVTSVADADDPQLLARAQAHPSGHYETQVDPDRVTRIVAYRKVDDYPFIVTVALAKDEALDDFNQHRSGYLIIASATSALIFLFFGVVTVLAIRLQRQRSQLKTERHFLETLVDNIPSGITVRSMRPQDTGQYVLCNESNGLIFGTGPKEALGKTVQDVMAAPYAAEIMEFDRQLLASPMVQDIVQVRDGLGKKARVYHLLRAPIFGADGRVDYIMTSATDITQERARMDELRLASKVFETAADAIVISDGDDRVIMVNAAFSKLTGYDATDIVGQILTESPFRPTDLADAQLRMEQQLREGFVSGEVPRFRKDGTPLSLWLSASNVRNADGTMRNYVRVFTDISLLKETQRRLEQLASFDTLTGLPNRRLLHDRLEQALLRASRNKVSTALMFVDLDGFKEVNDTLGHDVGDLLLRRVAIRLATCVRASDTIGRFGGDEFAIVLEGACLRVDCERVSKRIVAALAAPFDLDGHHVSAAASVGIAIYPSDGASAAALLKNADLAMYKSKRMGRNRFQFFADFDEPVASID